MRRWRASTIRPTLFLTTQETGEDGAMATARTAKNAASNIQLPPAVLEGIYTTMPYNDKLERATIPSTEKITEAFRELMR